jgi:hypothetical protein
MILKISEKYMYLSILFEYNNNFFLKNLLYPLHV